MFLINLRKKLLAAKDDPSNSELHPALNRLLNIVNNLIQELEANAHAHPGDNEDPRDITQVNAALQRQFHLLALYTAATQEVRHRIRARENNPRDIVDQMISLFNRGMTGLIRDANQIVQRHQDTINSHHAAMARHQAPIARPPQNHRVPRT